MIITTTTEKSDQLAIVKGKTNIMENMLEHFQVTDDSTLDIVADKIKQIKKLQRFIEQEKDKLVAPAKAIIAEARDKYDPYIKKCQNAEDILKMRAKKYMIAKEDERREAEARIAARVEKGTIKLETAVRKIEALPEAQNTVRTDTGSALRMSKRKVAEITDQNLIPDEYWIIDEVRVRREAIAREKSNLPQIPGVTIREEADLSSF